MQRDNKIQMDNIQGNIEYTGLKGLEPLEQTIVKGIVEEYSPLILRGVHNNFDLLVHVKAHHKTTDKDINKVDKRTNYSIHLKLIYATKNILNIDNMSDWDLPRGIHEAMVALLNRLKKEFKNDANMFKMRKSANKNANQIQRREQKILRDRKKKSVRRKTANRRTGLY